MLKSISVITMTMSEYMELTKVRYIQELQTRIIGRCISRLSRGEVTVDKYLETMRAVDRTEMAFARTFDTFDQFVRYLRSAYPSHSDVEDQIEHEGLHFQHAIRHGLADTKLGLYEMRDEQGLTINGVTIVYVGNNFRDWTAPQILKFERENYYIGSSDKSASDSDIAISGIFSTFE